MQSKEYLEKIKSYFTYLVTEIKCNTACGHFDINVIAENFYIPILSILFDCKALVNENVIKMNFPAVDLGCRETRKSFQVTSDSGSAKIIKTLEKFHEHKLNEHFDKLWVLILTEKQSSYSSKALSEEIKRQGIPFSVAENIIDYQDLLRLLSSSGIEKIEKVYEILRLEFERHSEYSRFRGELNSFLSFSNNKIEVEKNTKKYIPALFVESTKTKDTARLFCHPIFFCRKVEDDLRLINYTTFNKYLGMMDLAPISSDIVPVPDDKAPQTFSELADHLEKRKSQAAVEASKFKPFSYKSEGGTEYPVPASKETMRSLLKVRTENASWGIGNRYGEIIDLIEVMKAKVILITSLAGQGKTNFVCDLVENLFRKFEIPSVFVPGRELNSYQHPNRVVSFISQNRFIPQKDNIYSILEIFNRVAADLRRPFIIVMDGINEVKDLDGFVAEMIDFLGAVSQFDFVKVIITCRTEFFDAKFSSLLDQPFSSTIFRVKDLKADMSERNLDRMLESYISHFKVGVTFSKTASAFLKYDLLLMRIFCELYEDQQIGNVDEVYKVDLYEKYLVFKAGSLPRGVRPQYLPTLYKIVETMLELDRYHNIALGEFEPDQLDVVERLVSEDIILRREPSEQTLQSFAQETVSFTYDELRDFIIGYYLVMDLSSRSFEKVTSIVSRLEGLQIYEGVFKYLYLLGRKQKEARILDICESSKNFHVHYSIAIRTLPPSLQDDKDLGIVKRLLADTERPDVARRVARFLFFRKNKAEILNISVLIDHVNSLNDDAARRIINVFFDRWEHERYYAYSDDPVDKWLQGWLEYAEREPEGLSTAAVVFVMQIAFLANHGMQYDVRSALSVIKGRNLHLEAFAFAEQANSEKIASFARSIVPYRKEEGREGN